MWAWSLLPILLAVTAAGGCWAVFGMAMVNESVNITVQFPYISVCGAEPPQSCIFAQVMNVGSFLVTWVCVIRYQQVIDYGHQSALNIVSLVAGCLSAVGGSMVGNFQTVNQIHVHLVGAFLAFFIGNVYFWLQAALTYKIQPRHGGNWIGPVRIICSLVCTVCLCLVVLLHSLKRRTAAAICEWVAAMILLLLFGLFAVDFQHIGGHYFHVIQEKSRIQNSTTTLEL
ncbi:modulator of macroautophagy TMEM150B-like [Scyliorhinus canicula]|uniref:modulator of macroautophagy TMEM150B-like n=1 Tax=Scyliorhinus canicula TaxID=7830 RepID=UPI0018F3C96F|nr:modulator of macroautophagy TMEM150B-like [Scyliorhinus canicula]XP_038639656.1 modulator of macroautophagy TMEM150B-like [Scyliorhinus canicula]XP_038639657.1 modulator of macroautophagy TMEM150B-like [Scyliorhinus canicula]